MWRMISSCSGRSKICCAVHGRLSPMQPGELELPARDVDRLHLLDLVVGVEARRLETWPRYKSARACWVEQERLHAVVPFRHRRSTLCTALAVGDVAAGEHRQRAEADRAAQDLAAVDLLDQLAVLLEHALVDRVCCGRKIDGDGVRIVIHPSAERLAARGIASTATGASAACAMGAAAASTTGPPVTIATIVRGTSSASTM